MQIAEPQVRAQRLDERDQKRFLAESMAEFERFAKPTPDYDDKQRQGINAKDGFRRFGKLGGVQADAFAAAPRVIAAGTDFDDALATHQRLLGY